MSKINLKDFEPPHSPVLRLVARPVSSQEIGSDTLERDIARMLHVALGEQQDASKPLLVGLAAPQIGISKRIILVDVAAEGTGKVGAMRVFLNPVIARSSAETNEWYEGCFSTSRVCGIVSRPTTVLIHALDRNGVKIEQEFSGYTARIFQHEIDHLDGIEFVNHVTNDANLHWVEENEFPQYRNEAGWKNWPQKCSREKWARIKSGQE
jgi:peptide deformylase